MVTWFKSFCPTPSCIFAGGSVLSANSGALSGCKSFCLFTLSFSCACSAGLEEEEVEEEEEEQDGEGGFYLISEAFIPLNHFLKEYNTEFKDKRNTICPHHAWLKQIVAFTFVKFFIVYSLSLRGKLRGDGPFFNGNAFELTELPQ